MSNTSLYLDKSEKKKMKLVEQKTGLKTSQILRWIVKTWPVDYFEDFFEKYAEDIRKQS